MACDQTIICPICPHQSDCLKVGSCHDELATAGKRNRIIKRSFPARWCLREAMRALLRDVRNVDQVFLEAVTVEDIAARAFQIDAAWLPGLPFVHKAYFLAVQSL